MPICHTIQQKIHESHKIWHPSEQNYMYFFVHFNKRSQYFQGCAKILEIPEGRGWGKFWGLILEKSLGEGGHMANPVCGGGMDIFWNHTFQSIH